MESGPIGPASGCQVVVGGSAATRGATGVGELPPWHPGLVRGTHYFCLLLATSTRECPHTHYRCAGDDSAPGGRDQWTNCASSVEPVSAVVEDSPPAITCATSSK